MPQRALVIRTFGNPEWTQPIAHTLTRPCETPSPALVSKLQAELGVARLARSMDYQRKIQEARQRYAVRRPSPAAAGFLRAVGLVCLIVREHQSNRCPKNRRPAERKRKMH